MKTRCRKSARIKPTGSDTKGQPQSFSLLALPVEVLHQVLDLLDDEDLVKLVHTSKTMALAVMQHISGNLAFKVVPGKGSKLAAIRQLLWATPSTLRLVLGGFPAVFEWDSLIQALHGALSVPGSKHGQQPQQLTCISEVCIKDCTLPQWVPLGLTAMCPNMKTLHLHYCTICPGSGDSSNNSSSSKAISRAHGHGRSSRGSSSKGSRALGSHRTGTRWLTGGGTADHLHNLVLENVRAPFLAAMALPAGNARATRGMQQAVQYAEQLRSSLPNLTCLESIRSEAVQVISMLQPHLTELYIPLVRDMTEVQEWWDASLQLQKLQKLLLPYATISESDVKKLLSLPSLTHVQFASISHGFVEDYSSHPCKWQTLQLDPNTRGQSIDTLAKLPLHSLTQPLKLGSAPSAYGQLQLHLPTSRREDGFGASLERLAQRLQMCGVQMLESHVAWMCQYRVDPAYKQAKLSLGAQHAHAIITLGPAFGRHARLKSTNIVIDRPVLEAVATVYGSELQQLELEDCIFEKNMQAAWHVGLSALPALQRLLLTDCVCDTSDGGPKKRATMMAEVVRQLAAALAQQPAGRYIEVFWEDDRCYETSPEFAELVLDSTELSLLGLDIKPLQKGDDTSSQDKVWYLGHHDKDKACIRITSKGGH